MKNVGQIIGMCAAILLFSGCTEKPLAPAAQIHTPDEQTVTIDGEKHRMPIAGHM